MDHFIIIIEVFKQVLIDFFIGVILTAAFQTFEMRDVILLFADVNVIFLANLINYLVIVQLYIISSLNYFTITLLLWLILVLIFTVLFFNFLNFSLSQAINHISNLNFLLHTTSLSNQFLLIWLIVGIRLLYSTLLHQVLVSILVLLE